MFSLGGFLGLVIGLSASPVSYVVVSALASVLLVVLNLPLNLRFGPIDGESFQAHRDLLSRGLFSFCIASTLSVVGGLTARTYFNSPKFITTMWINAGMSPPDAQRIAERLLAPRPLQRNQEVPLPLQRNQEVSLPTTNRSAGAVALYSDRASVCEKLDGYYFDSAAKRLVAFAQQDDLASIAKGLHEGPSLGPALDGLYTLYCEVPIKSITERHSP